ncbi:MAG TPA: aspartate 1-decarboxylase [Acidobacteriota bacterium]|nr:aspartate 1-decarboxylase [Acidobacteriota bacterium]
MLIQVCRAKIHRAHLTGAHLDYEGSISICPDLLKASGIRVYERVQVVNIANGSRLETYVIEGKRGKIDLNGAAARLGQVGDLIIIIAYALIDPDKEPIPDPTFVHVDSENRIRP